MSITILRLQRYARSIKGQSMRSRDDPHESQPILHASVVTWRSVLEHVGRRTRLPGLQKTPRAVYYLSWRLSTALFSPLLEGALVQLYSKPQAQALPEPCAMSALWSSLGRRQPRARSP